MYEGQNRTGKERKAGDTIEFGRRRWVLSCELQNPAVLGRRERGEAEERHGEGKIGAWALAGPQLESGEC